MRSQCLTASVGTVCLALTVLMAWPVNAQTIDDDLQRAVDARDWRVAIALVDRMIAAKPKAPRLQELRAYRKRLEALLKSEPTPPGLPTGIASGSSLPTLRVPVSRIASYNEQDWCNAANARSSQKPFGVTQARVHFDPNQKVLQEQLIGCLTNNSSASNYMLTITCVAPEASRVMMGTLKGPPPGKTAFFDTPFTLKVRQVSGCDLDIIPAGQDKSVRVQRWLFREM
jgi:hypothetical protein